MRVQLEQMQVAECSNLKNEPSLKKSIDEEIVEGISNIQKSSSISDLDSSPDNESLSTDEVYFNFLNYKIGFKFF